ncbi:MAG: four helix bundle protein [Saprospiraceae bacterium]|nr:four helix bundle protein [Saprospiraceae bacterium]
MEVTGFENLEIYKRSIELRKKTFKIANLFPKEEKYNLTDQIIRSTRKCPSNIAEGYGRYPYQENIQFCRIARGSLCETVDHLTCALECDYITEEEYSTLKEQTTTLIKMINGYIRYLKTRKQQD